MSIRTVVPPDLRPGGVAAATRPAGGRRRAGRVAVLLALLAVAATTLYPFWYMAANSLKTNAEYLRSQYSLPPGLHLANFVLLRDNVGVFGALGNSAFVVITAVAASTAISALASFALAKVPFTLSGPVFTLIIGMLLVPGQVLLVPLYLFFSQLHLIDNYASLICVYTATALPLGVFLLTANFRAVPDEMIEAARMDGASIGRTFVSIVLPTARPAVVTLAVLSFLNMWNELLLALLLIPAEAKRLLTPALTALVGNYVTNEPLLLSGLLVNTLPTIIVLIVFARYIVSGTTLGLGK